MTVYKFVLVVPLTFFQCRLVIKSINIIVRTSTERVVKASDMKSRDPEFKFFSDPWPDLFLVVSGSTPKLHLYMTNLFASCQLGFLTCSVH